MGTERFLVTDVTRMSGATICVAGYVRDAEGRAHCVRPVLAESNISERWLRTAEPEVVRPFAVLMLNMLRADPHPPHGEDWLFEPEFVGYERLLSEPNRLAFIEEIVDESVAAIFDGCLRQGESLRGWWVEPDTDCRSLGTVLVRSPRVWFDPPSSTREKWNYRITFQDAADREYRLTFTDLAARRYLQHSVRDRGLSAQTAGIRFGDQLRDAGHCYLRLGLTRPWSSHDGLPAVCWLQVTGIYSFPDYLDGRCHADFPAEYA